MNDIVIRLKSGREFRFKCEEYTIETYALNGTLTEFSYEGGVGECPVYFQKEDVECIAIMGKEQIEALEQVPSEDCIDRYSALAELDPLSYEYKAIKELPSVVPTTEQSSLVDIVRCKDCMLNTINTDGATEPWCYKFGYAVEDTDFCSFGERRAEQ